MDMSRDDIGIEARLREVWNRYRTTIAVTEVHHGCSRDEQLRWFSEVWKTALRLRKEHVDLKAVTIWSMFGVVDWNTLLTSKAGHYEPGAFDIRTGEPRPTALAAAAKKICRNGDFDHPVLDTPGWWHRPDHYYRPQKCEPNAIKQERKVLLIAAQDESRAGLVNVLRHRGLHFTSISPTDRRLLRPLSLSHFLKENDIWAIVCFASSLAEPLIKPMAIIGREAGSQMLVLRGVDDRLVTGCEESYAPDAILGAGSQRPSRVTAADPGSPLIICGPEWFGTGNARNRILEIIAASKRGQVVQLCTETRATATYMPDLFHAGLDLLIDGATDRWWLANSSDLSWFEFGQRLVEQVGLDRALIIPKEPSAPSRAQPSPAHQSLMPDLMNAAERYFRAIDAEDDNLNAGSTLEKRSAR